MKIGYLVFERLFPILVDKPIISRIRVTLFTSTLDMNFLDRYHKAVTPSGVNFGKGLMSFWYWTNLGLYWCINRYIKVTRLFFNELFMFDMACPRWWIILGRCWADVGPVGPTSGHWRPCFLGYLGHCMTDHYGGIAYCFLCIVYSYFHVCFICSLIIILCVLKTIQPTPLVVEPGRYKYSHFI